MQSTLFLRGFSVRLFGFRRIGIGLDYHIDLGTFFELDFFSLIVRQGVLNANFSVKVIGTFNSNLGFLGHCGMRRGYNLLNLSRFYCFGLLH